jgi:hypothetical protein
VKLEVEKKSYRGWLSWWAGLKQGAHTNASGRRQRKGGSPKTRFSKVVLFQDAGKMYKVQSRKEVEDSNKKEKKPYGIEI